MWTLKLASVAQPFRAVFPDRLKRVGRRAIACLDSATSNQRKGIAVAVSLLLHLALLLSMLPDRTGGLKIGSTGVGEFNGSGIAITLVPGPKRTQDQHTNIQNVTVTPDAGVMSDAKMPTTPSDETTSKSASENHSESDAQFESDSGEEQGAFGQNGQAFLDLWNAVSPCWRRIAGDGALPATLTVSFDNHGGLSAPPIIERAPEAFPSEDSLHAEAMALQALAECGSYSMAKNLQNVKIKFPSGQSSATAVKH